MRPYSVLPSWPQWSRSRRPPSLKPKTLPPLPLNNLGPAATPAGARTGAVYMTLANKANTADSLTGASSDVAAKVQIHEMAVINGVMQMRQPVNGLAIPAGGSVTLKPGSYHVMLIGLKRALTAGEAVPLTLTFAKPGIISVTVPVKAMGASQNDQGDMSGMGMQPKKAGSMGRMERK